MFDQLFEGFRKASESALQAQQDMFKQWVQQIPTAPMGTAKASGDWNMAFQKRWTEAVTDTLKKHRELLDSSYEAGIQILEQGVRVSDAKSPEEFKRLIEELWRKLSDSFKEQSEAQFRELQKGAERFLEMAQKVPA